MTLKLFIVAWTTHEKRARFNHQRRFVVMAETPEAAIYRATQESRLVLLPDEEDLGWQAFEEEEPIWDLGVSRVPR